MDLLPAFARAVAGSFQEIMKAPQVFVADIEGDELWAKYLAAFPEGSNPIFKTRTEHDCSTCRHFIRRAGAVISVTEDGKVRTIWDRVAAGAYGPYIVVADAMAAAILSVGIRDIFRVGSKELGFGAKTTRSIDKVTQRVHTWNHLHTDEIPSKFRVALPDTARGTARMTAQVFERGLRELSPEAIETVRGLIESNALYRGDEHKRAVVDFQKVQRAFREKTAKEQSLFVWANSDSKVARFRSTVIGTLVQDLTEGMELEAAVRSFEAKVAPTNYKRTTALITPGMVKKAMEKIEELGLEPALERRLARLTDVSVNDVKWVNSTSRGKMKGGIGDLLMKHAEGNVPVTAQVENAQDISLETFMTDVLPKAQSLELFFTSEHAGNLMVLTAPVHPEPKQLFKWNNDFAWSYGGNVTDSIKERVKKAGGRVEGAALRVSLSWFNFDDLDLHIHEPRSRGVRGVFDRIYFGARTGWTGGTLDVDMNAGGRMSREAVENVVWTKTMPDGPYRIVVNNFAQRETNDPGFVIEVECDGKVSHFSYNKQVRDKQDITVATLHMKDRKIERIEEGDAGVTASNVSLEKWGLTSERFVKVETVMLSPNYWGDNAVGNKHTFFVLEGAKCDEEMRGFYNEFLHSRLEENRKVFEVIGDKTKCALNDDHIAGLGFSSTKRDTFLVRVQQGKKQLTFNIHV